MQRQLIISENSVPTHIATWAQSRSRDTAIVIAHEATSVVRACVETARKAGLPVSFDDSEVERQL